MLDTIFRDAGRSGLTEDKPEGAIDSTGLDATHRSSHYAWRLGKRYRMRKWPKCTLVCETSSHLIASALFTRGPSQDAPLFEPALSEACRRMPIDRLLADGGYDSEANHVTARELLGIRSTVINVNRRGKRAWPRGRYRRQMVRRFHRRKYGQRWQVESVISRLKRRLGSHLRGRSEPAKEREGLMRIVTHNLMILSQGP